MSVYRCQLVRPTIEDADLLSELARRCYLQHFSSLWGEDRLANYLDEKFGPGTLTRQLASTQDCSFLLARIADRPIGYCKINWHKPDPLNARAGAQLRHIFVDARLTGRGIGGRLLQASVALAREQSVDELWLQVMSDNEEARRFFRRYGFAMIGSVPFATDIVDSDQVVMVSSFPVSQ